MNDPLSAGIENSVSWMTVFSSVFGFDFVVDTKFQCLAFGGEWCTCTCRGRLRSFRYFSEYR